MVGDKRRNFSGGYIKVKFSSEKKCIFVHSKCSWINSLKQTKAGGRQQTPQALLSIPAKEDRQCRQTIMLVELPNMSV